MSTAQTDFKPTGLRQYRYFESQDLEVTRAAIAKILQPHDLVPLRRTARVNSYMDMIRLGQTTLGALSFGDAMRVDAGHLDDFYLFVFCLNGYAEVRTTGRTITIGRDYGLVCGPGEPFEASFSEECEQLVLRIDRSAMLSHTAARIPEFDPVLDLSNEALAPWYAQVRSLATSARLLEMAAQRAHIGVALERLLVLLLLAGQPHRDDAPGVEPGSIAPGAVKRAEAFIEANACEPVRLIDIAAAADVSVRTLLTSFQKFRATSPMQMLRAVRLQRVRQKLLCAPVGTAVTEVALECGFTHIGRFANAYQQCFGEMPSETLRRSRN